MKIYDYIINGGTFFNSSLVYPSCIDEDIQSEISNNIKFRFAFHEIRPTIEEMSEFFDSDIYTLIPSFINSICKTNAYKYETLFNTLDLDYNPITNYDMSETETINNDKSGTITNNKSGSESDTLTNSLTDTRDINTSDSESKSFSSDVSATNETASNETESVYAFNSAEWEGENKKVISGDTTASESNNTEESNTLNKSGTITDTHTGTASNTKTTGENTNETQNISEDETRTLSRSGNIGVTTTQQMIESEREIALFSFVEVITGDIIKEICINVM